MENKKKVLDDITVKDAVVVVDNSNPFTVSLADFIASIPEGVSVAEYLKDYSADEIETVEREIKNFKK